MIRALMVHQKEDGSVDGGVEMIDPSDLPQEGEVLVEVDWSNLNFKDGLCMTGGGKLVREYPHIPGVDMNPPMNATLPVIRFCSPAGVTVRSGGAAMLNRHGSKPTGLCRCPKASPRVRPWPSARRASRRCSLSWRSKNRGCSPAPATFS